MEGIWKWRMRVIGAGAYPGCRTIIMLMFLEIVGVFFYAVGIKAEVEVFAVCAFETLKLRLNHQFARWGKSLTKFACSGS